jgi:hypothetical protein
MSNQKPGSGKPGRWAAVERLSHYGGIQPRK